MGCEYATTLPTVTPIEQHIHSFLEIIPLMAIVSVVSLHWQQFLAVFGAGSEPLRTDLSWKPEPLPILYVIAILVLLFELLPYLEEFWRGLRANRGRLIPTNAKEAKSDQAR